jgi:hypothetical protein
VPAARQFLHRGMLRVRQGAQGGDQIARRRAAACRLEFRMEKGAQRRFFATER